jgi:hypothetical protein
MLLRAFPLLVDRAGSWTGSGCIEEGQVKTFCKVFSTVLN